MKLSPVHKLCVGLMGFVGLTGCFLFQLRYTYSKTEIEGVLTDTTFLVSVDEILDVIKESLLNMGFEIEREQEYLFVTFPLYIEKENFGEYAVEKADGGYKPVNEDVLYAEPSVELHCIVIPVADGIRVKVKVIFEAFRKDILYRETPGKDISKGYYEIEGAFIECRSTGKIERALFDRISEVLNTEE